MLTKFPDSEHETILGGRHVGGQGWRRSRAMAEAGKSEDEGERERRGRASRLRPILLTTIAPGVDDDKHQTIDTVPLSMVWVPSHPLNCSMSLGLIA